MISPIVPRVELERELYRQLEDGKSVAVLTFDAARAALSQGGGA